MPRTTSWRGIINKQEAHGPRRSPEGIVSISLCPWESILDIEIIMNSHNTCSGPHNEHLYKVRCQSLQPFLKRSRKCLSQAETRTAILDFAILAEGSNTCLGPHKEHLYQVRSQSLQPFLKRSRKCLSQSMAILDFSIRAKSNNTCSHKLEVNRYSHS